MARNVELIVGVKGLACWPLGCLFGAIFGGPSRGFEGCKSWSRIMTFWGFEYGGDHGGRSQNNLSHVDRCTSPEPASIASREVVIVTSFIIVAVERGR